jgi:NOL1/NOP2/fmu family ribosome biogenesis protein
MAYEKQFYFKKAGCVLGEIKGKDVVPNQELAWSDDRNTNINQIELNKEDALKFLRKENFSIIEKTKGFVLVTYKNYGLGWAKILPNRINNYLPNELRILK